MHIMFLTNELEGGAGNHRAFYPHLWINKFTEHTSVCYEVRDSLAMGFSEELTTADVLVFHNPVSLFPEMIAKVKRSHPHIRIVYDTDDYHYDMFLQYHINSFIGDLESILDKMIDYADGITVASTGLHHYFPAAKPKALIPNAFDVRMAHNQPQPDKYNYDGNIGERYKIVWGGGSSHSRDLEMFLRLGVVEELSIDYNLDWFFYNALPKNHKRVINKSIIKSLPKALPDRYIYELYRDADLLIAPLLTETYDYTNNRMKPDMVNNCRSVLKLMEAGVAGIPYIASDAYGYRLYEGGGKIVSNTKDQWVEAIKYYLDNEDARIADGKANNAIVCKDYNAEKVTHDRIKFYEEL